MRLEGRETLMVGEWPPGRYGFAVSAIGSRGPPEGPIVTRGKKNTKNKRGRAGPGRGQVIPSAKKGKTCNKVQTNFARDSSASEKFLVSREAAR